MSGCYWVSGEWVWQRLMLNRALTLKIKARLPRRDFDMMINQFKMTSLPLLILLPPPRIIQSRDLHPANHCWVFCISGVRQPWETGHLYYARPTFCWDFDKTAHQTGFVWWHLGGGSDGPLYWGSMQGHHWTGWLDLMLCLLSSCLVLCRMMQMSPGFLLRGSYFKLTVL